MTKAPASVLVFPDGAPFRIEIPSCEGPDALEAVIDEALKRRVVVHRVSQGSGALMLTSAEIRAMASLGAQAGIEVSIFARPTASWDIGAMVGSRSGSAVGPHARGLEQLTQCVEEIFRLGECGIRSVLVTDPGVLKIGGELRAAGELPGDMRFKVSVGMGVANPAFARLVESLGADSLNLPTDLSVLQVASIRAAISIPLDLYVESPDDLGGFMRYHEIAELVAAGAPVYLKFGLRNAPDMYPSGGHLRVAAELTARERVRRAQIGLEHLVSQAPHLVIEPASPSPTSGDGLPLAEGEEHRN